MANSESSKLNELKELNNFNVFDEEFLKEIGELPTLPTRDIEGIYKETENDIKEISQKIDKLHLQKFIFTNLNNTSALCDNYNKMIKTDPTIPRLNKALSNILTSIEPQLATLRQNINSLYVGEIDNMDEQLKQHYNTIAIEISVLKNKIQNKLLEIQQMQQSRVSSGGKKNKSKRKQKINKNTKHKKSRRKPRK